MLRFFKFVYYFHSFETKTLRAEALESAKQFYANKPMLTSSNPRPSVIDYEVRKSEFQAYQRGYINQRCHNYAVVMTATTTN
jgi:hypothetical protein